MKDDHTVVKTDRNPHPQAQERGIICHTLQFLK